MGRPDYQLQVLVYVSPSRSVPKVTPSALDRVRKKLITLPLLPLLHPLSTDEAHRHTGVAALRGHTGHTITNGVVGSVGVSHFFVFFSFFP
jgi:hypothetical protein